MLQLDCKFKLYLKIKLAAEKLQLLISLTSPVLLINNIITQKQNNNIIMFQPIKKAEIRLIV
ncbi:hypothetical protein SC1083_1830 [Aggregatibacter actinomycetemcomitans serotype e str. SC1083]|uniref:Uncharacterized protein n=1 Tax=Aggregatibacter actinomycetemcomitans serotype e str. SC1083 TaxID=907488 RepID=G4AAF7_AGGAC|nr:hypothetical protein SC1083_1830 [Aggregatibacter actinomycetemcomitans serotype e str. SC1083]